MRSFRLSRYSPPKKIAAEYSENERAQFKKQFEPIARSYRRTSKRVVWIFLSLAFLFLIFFVLGSKGIIPQQFVSKFALFFTALLFIFIFAVLILAIKYDPVCPACEKGVDHVLRTFCPECGNEGLVHNSFFTRARCLSCSKVFAGGKGRCYKIRFCTHCGILLDEEGI
jgi:ribosomal protein S27E